jgi:uncharacterized membrane protein
MEKNYVTQTSQSTQPGIAENVAGLLCYAFGWVTGLIFFLIDKRPFVRFHAAQSMIVFGGLHALSVVIATSFGAGLILGAPWTGFGFAWLLYGLVRVVAFVLWIVLMIKAYQGERYAVPVAGDFAQKMAGNQLG